MKKVKMEDMTWHEIKEAIEVGKRTVILVIGSTEQHGPHLPVGTDSMLGEVSAERLARELGDALLAPTIAYGCSDHHMSFPGTISISPELLKKIIGEVCSSLSQHGFKNIVLIPAHGGNFTPVKEVAPKLIKELDLNIIIAGTTSAEEYYELTGPIMAKFMISPNEAGSHAGATETSTALSLIPDLVKKESMEKGYIGDVDISKVWNTGIHFYTDNGVLGDPFKATKEAGDMWVNLRLKLDVEKIRKAVSASCERM